VPWARGATGIFDRQCYVLFDVQELTLLPKGNQLRRTVLRPRYPGFRVPDGDLLVMQVNVNPMMAGFTSTARVQTNRNPEIHINVVWAEASYNSDSSSGRLELEILQIRMSFLLL
jgi:hypothetical protein